MSRLIYFDNNATTPVAPEVIGAITQSLADHFANPSSVHALGKLSALALQGARAELASLLKCQPQEIYFTSGGTESNNTIIQGMARSFPKGHFITTQVEHAATREVFSALEKAGHAVTRLAVDSQGVVDTKQLAKSFSPNTCLVSIIYANNETGVISPIEEIAAITEQQGVALHVDAVQAVGKLPLDLSKLPVSFLSLSGHKFHGPKGIGALYARQEQRWSPLLHGGPQEKGKRPGTEALANIVGMAKAAQLADEFLLANQMAQVAKLRNQLEEGICQLIPEAVIIGRNAPRLANTTTIAFPGLSGEALLYALSQEGVCVSYGAACSSGSLEPSVVLQAMSLPMEWTLAAVRFSLSRYNTQEEVAFLLNKLPPIVHRFAKMRSLF